VQTNYVLPGYEFPAKLATSEKIDVINLAANLLYDQATGDKQEVMSAIRLFKEEVSYYVDRDSLRDTVFNDIDFSQCKKLTWVRDKPRSSNDSSAGTRAIGQGRPPGEEAAQGKRLAASRRSGNRLLRPWKGLQDRKL
jgi:hypothetical protein